jgi:hypothetical protein
MCHCGCCQHNQTPTKSIDALCKAIENGTPTKGWAVFVVPDPERGPLRVRGFLMDNLEYDDCCARGEICIVFKWIHNGLQTLSNAEAELLQKKQSHPLLPCGGHCNDGQDCVLNICYCYKHRCHFPIP